MNVALIPSPNIKPMLLAHDHSDLDELLAEFSRALAAGDVAQSFEKLDLFWARLAVHIRAEHLHLFPTLLHALESLRQTKEAPSRAPSFEAAQDTISELRQDHDFFMSELAAAIRYLRQLRESTHQDKSTLVQKVREKIVAVSERLKVHNELEESDIYPLAKVLLTPAECVALGIDGHHDAERHAHSRCTYEQPAQRTPLFDRFRVHKKE